MVQLSRCFHSTLCMPLWRSYNPGDASPQRRFGLFPVRSPLLRESLLFSLPPGTKMFQFPGLAPATLMLQVTVLQTDGLSHSEIHGSKDICSYPRLIAAYHVLHRLREPRHPPDALTCFRLLAGHMTGTPRKKRGAQPVRGIAHTFSCI